MRALCGVVDESDGSKYRLPTELGGEYAARARTLSPLLKTIRATAIS
jgi:formylglycine-generating enzyme required for sulfatase activity